MIRIGQTEPIAIGYQGETLSRLVEFDVSPILTEFGTGGVFAIVNKRKYGDLAYPIPIENYTLEGSTLKWTITDTELCYSGKGRVQIKYTLNGSVVKTAVFDTLISASLGAISSVPAPMQSYIDQLTDLAGDVQVGAQAAADSAEDAATSEANALSYKNAASASATAASGSAGTAAYWAGKSKDYSDEAKETSDALKDWVDETKETLKGEKGDKGDQGPQGIPGPTGAMGGSGVYVGGGTAPNGYNVQIDTEGDVTSLLPTPVAKTDAMTSPVGIDEDGHLWASPNAEGLIDPDEKTDAMTFPVGIDEDGKLWSYPGFNRAYAKKTLQAGSKVHIVRNESQYSCFLVVLRGANSNMHMTAIVNGYSGGSTRNTVTILSQGSYIASAGFATTGTDDLDFVIEVSGSISATPSTRIYVIPLTVDDTFTITFEGEVTT